VVPLVFKTSGLRAARPAGSIPVRLRQDDNDPAGSLADIPLVPNAATNPGGSELDCSALAPVEEGLPAHSAPLGMTFLEGSTIAAPWSNGAVLAAHGSWDRRPHLRPIRRTRPRAAHS
jgi:hypothetical protein